MSLSQDDDQRSTVVRGVPRQVADVHEHVIEQLAAVRLTLRGVEGAMYGGPLASRLRDGMAELDDAIEELRGAGLRRLPEPAGDGGLAGRLLTVVREAYSSRDCAAHLQFSGMDVTLPDDVEADLRAVLRQALTDVQHQQADVEVRVAATADRLTAQVTGYGSGTASGPEGRARDHDGSSAGELRQQGQRMTWTVPLGGLFPAQGGPATPAVPGPRRPGNGDPLRG
jgi:signal transduction histidine kinase